MRGGLCCLSTCLGVCEMRVGHESGALNWLGLHVAARRAIVTPLAHSNSSSPPSRPRHSLPRYPAKLPGAEPEILFAPLTSPCPTMADLDSSVNSSSTADTPDAPSADPPAPAMIEPSPKHIMLPMELVCLILDFVNPSDQETFAAACKVCRQWNLAARSYL